MINLLIHRFISGLRPRNCYDMAFLCSLTAQPLLRSPAFTLSRWYRGSISRQCPRYYASLTTSPIQSTSLSTTTDPPSNAISTSSDRKRIIFLGSPEVAAETLQYLWDHSEAGRYEIVAVITKPPTRPRKKVIQHSPVYERAEKLGIVTKLTPYGPLDSTLQKQLPDSDKSGITVIRNLQPDLFITAAYGFRLPKSLLDVPKFGTLNIHPSLLPSYRGAAPVQRALEAGEKVTGVCIVRTVEKMDAGPILYDEQHELQGDELAGEVMEDLFMKGNKAMVEKVLPSILWDGERSDATFVEKIQETEQSETNRVVSSAKKVQKEEGIVTFSENALQIHNKVRALSMWPGTWARFVLRNPDGVGEDHEIVFKIKRTEVEAVHKAAALGVHDVLFDKGALRVVCDDGSILRVLELQKGGGNVMSATAFWNGLRGRCLERKRLPY